MILQTLDEMPLECGETGTVPGHAPSLLPRGRDFRLVWNDEFDGDALDASKWRYRVNFWGKRAGWFAGPEDGAVEVADSVCRLRARKTPDGRYVSPQLQTGELMWDIPRLENPSGFWPLPKREPPTFLHRFGFWECRCRLQRRPGWWSAFWTQSPMQGCSLDPVRAGIEHDVMESFEPGMVIPHTMHFGGYGANHGFFKCPRKTSDEKVRLALDPEPFHHFAMLWEEDGYTFYVDGRRRGPKVGAGPGEFVSRTGCFLLVSTELKGFRGKNVVEGPMALEKDASFDALVADDAFEVDFVRVYDFLQP